MAFLIDEAHLPAILTVGPMTDEAFAQLCAGHPNLNLELSALGELIIMPPAYTWTDARNNEISAQLRNWARQDKRGIAFDSSAGWLLPNTARRSPDAAWILKHRIKDLDPAAFSRYWPVCPNFVARWRSIGPASKRRREAVRLRWKEKDRSRHLCWISCPCGIR